MLSKDLQLSIFAAFREAKRRRHEFLTVEHITSALLFNELAQYILESLGIDVEGLRTTMDTFLERTTEKLPEGIKRDPIETPAFQRVIQRAMAHMQSAGKESVDAGDMLVSIMHEEDSHSFYYLTQAGLTRLELMQFVSHGPSPDHQPPQTDDDSDREQGNLPAKSALEQFCTNLNAKAARGDVDPLIGRNPEMRRVQQILCRRQKNNPILVGDPGTGKTALAEGLALAISEGRVPAILRKFTVFSLDLGSLVAGTKFRGQFEERLKGVMNELVRHENAILYIDEIHTIIGAGSTSGGNLDASNILKPALASGKMRCMGSTTHEDYRQIFDKDRALSRRFQTIHIEEPSQSEALQILRGLKSRYEQHHHIRYTDAALKTAVELSAKYITDRRLPDKAVDVIDEAAAALHLLPPSAQRHRVVPSDIEAVVSLIARVPVQTDDTDMTAAMASLPAALGGIVFGQDEAVLTLTRALRRSRAGLGHPDHPLGSFLFTGPTGVGKTEVCRQLAKQLGIELLRFDMSEYMEKHAVARLIGSPPGYVGFEQGGLLTEAVRRTPHAVLLLDEIEKAHEDIFNILLQIMDHAALTDNTGRKSDFHNIILVMTSNAGAREMSQSAIGFGDPHGEALNKGRSAIEKLFSPEFRNRLDETIVFKPLTAEVMLLVVDKFVNLMRPGLRARGITIDLDDKAREFLATRGYDPVYGARPLDRLIQTSIKDPLSEEILFGRLSQGGHVIVHAGPDGLVFEIPELV